MNKVENGSTVTLHYKGTLDNGDIFDTSRAEGREPFSFQAGARQVIPGFDTGVMGMAVGETKTITIEVEDAYGPRMDQMIFEAPLDRLPQGIGVGTQLQVMTPQGPMIAAVIDINEEAGTAKIDHNHPLAGERLTFELEVLDIQ